MDAPDQSEIIVITAPRLPEAPGEAVYSGFQIDPIVLDTATRLDQALAIAPSASLFRRNDSGAANPTVQGMSLRSIGPSGAGRALVTLDGVPQHDPFGGWVIWGALAPETIARARIVRGGGAGPYGAGALTGAVMLDERTAQGAALRVEAGEHGFMRLGGAGVIGDNGLNVLLAAAMEHDDGWIPVERGRGEADAALWRDAASGAARVQASRGRILISARLSAYDEARGSGLAGADSSATGQAASLTLVAAPSADEIGWRLQAWARGSDMTNAFVAVAPNRAFTTPASLQFETPAFGWGANAALRWADGEIGLDVRAADGETHELFRFIGDDFTRTRVAGGETLSIGAYAEGWRELGETLVSGGVRLDWWSAAEGLRLETDRADGAAVLDVRPEDSHVWAPTARVGARRAFGAMALRVAAYSSFRPPTLNELHRPFRVGNDITEANAALKPEHLFGVDAALEGAGAAADWSIGVFAVRLADPITNVTLGLGPGTFPPGVFVPAGGVYRARRNGGRIEAFGVEADAHGQFGAAGAWRAALSYTDAKMDGGDVASQLTGLRPAQAPALSVTAGVSWGAWRGGTFSADARYESTRFEDDQNARRLAPSARIDLSFEQDLIAASSLFIALDNAFDAATQTGETADGVTSLGAPRTLRVGVRVGR
jgi:outer membrane cobalamin receptor